MPSYKKWLIGVGVGVAFAACSAALLFVPVEPGLPLLQKQRVEEAVLSQLHDPYSAHLKFRGWAHVTKRDANGQLIPDMAHWDSKRGGKVVEEPATWYCGQVNAKNKYGAYAGNEYFAANVATGVAFIGQAITKSSLSKELPLDAEEWCTDTIITFRNGKMVYFDAFDRKARPMTDVTQ